MYLKFRLEYFTLCTIPISYRRFDYFDWVESIWKNSAFRTPRRLLCPEFLFPSFGFRWDRRKSSSAYGEQYSKNMWALAHRIVKSRLLRSKVAEHEKNHWPEGNMWQAIKCAHRLPSVGILGGSPARPILHFELGPIREDSFETTYLAGWNQKRLRESESFWTCPSLHCDQSSGCCSASQDYRLLSNAKVPNYNLRSLYRSTHDGRATPPSSDQNVIPHRVVKIFHFRVSHRSQDGREAFPGYVYTLTVVIAQ